MGAAAVRKRLGLPPQKERLRVRRLDIDLPAALVERLVHHHEKYLKETGHTEVGLRGFLLAVLAGALRQLDQQEAAEEARGRLVQPAGGVILPAWARESGEHLRALKGA